MVNAARAQGRPMIVMAMMTAAIVQHTAVHSPPNTIHRILSSSDAVGIEILRCGPTLLAPHNCLRRDHLRETRAARSKLARSSRGLAGGYRERCAERPPRGKLHHDRSLHRFRA